MACTANGYWEEDNTRDYQQYLHIITRIPGAKEPGKAPVNVLKQELLNTESNKPFAKNPLSDSFYANKKTTVKTAQQRKKMPWDMIENNPEHPINTRRRLAFFQTFAEMSN